MFSRFRGQLRRAESLRAAEACHSGRSAGSRSTCVFLPWQRIILLKSLSGPSCAALCAHHCHPRQHVLQWAYLRQPSEGWRALATTGDHPEGLVRTPFAVSPAPGADVLIKKSKQHRSAEGARGIRVLLLANFGLHPTGFRRDCPKFSRFILIF